MGKPRKNGYKEIKVLMYCSDDSFRKVIKAIHDIIPHPLLAIDILRGDILPPDNTK